MGRERSAFHPGQEGFPPTKAVYICADQPCPSLFRLQFGGGPYMSGLSTTRTEVGFTNFRLGHAPSSASHDHRTILDWSARPNSLGTRASGVTLSAPGAAASD